MRRSEKLAAIIKAHNEAVESLTEEQRHAVERIVTATMLVTHDPTLDPQGCLHHGMEAEAAGKLYLSRIWKEGWMPMAVH